MVYRVGLEVRTMSPRFLCLILLGLLCLSSNLMAEVFELQPTLEIYVGNDSGFGPDTAGNPEAQGFHIWNMSTNSRQVAFCVYDLLEVAEGIGADFVDVNVSHVGYQYLGDVDVYAVQEAYEDLVTESMTWNTAPGVKKTAVGTPVELETSQLSELLLSFKPVETQRVFSDNSDKLSEFMSSDTNGKLVLMFAPPAEGSMTTLLTLFVGECGTFLHGDVSYTPRRAKSPSPPQEQEDVYCATSLNWTAGQDTITHTVYLSTDMAAVQNGDSSSLVAEGLTEATYTPAEHLTLGETYYWRVDEVNPSLDPVAYEGIVWSFTVEPTSYPIDNVSIEASSFESAEKSPEKLIDGSGLINGLHDADSANMWIADESDESPWLEFAFDQSYYLAEMKVWNYNIDYESALGFGIKELVVEISIDGENWSTIDDITDFNQAPGTANYATDNIFNLHNVQAQFVRFTIIDNFSDKLDKVGLSEVQFSYYPAHARVPSPVDGSLDVDIAPELSWRAGREATAHEVYFSTDVNLVTAGDASVLLDTVTEDHLLLDELKFAETYYWRVDAINAQGTVSGEVWSFATPTYLILDDFDEYDDFCNRIYWSWQDGLGYEESEYCGVSEYEGNGSNSYVGYADPPFAERTQTHEGSYQSLPLDYDNSGSPYYSSASTQDYLLPRDWTAGGVDTLNIHIKGSPADLTEISSDHFIISGGGADIYGTSDEFRYVYKTLSGDGSLVARVESIVNTDPWAKAGVMIRDSLNASSRWVMMLVSTQSGARLHQRLQTAGEATTDTELIPEGDPQFSVAPPAWIKIERVGDLINGYYATDEAGTQWVAAAGNPQDIGLSSGVTIGFAVCSHNSNAMTAAEFTNIACSESGSWQVKDIGIDQPFNSAEPVYLTIKDGSNHSKTIIHPNEAATQLMDWTAWSIPLSEFSGIDLGHIKSLTVGVGHIDDPSSGGSGLLFIDSIRLSSTMD